MKKWMIFFTCLLALPAFAQKSKTYYVEGFRGVSEVLTVNYNYNMDDQLENIHVLFEGRDQRYGDVPKDIILFSGTIQEFVDYLSEIVRFARENENNVSKYIQGHRVMTDDQVRNSCYIYGKDGEHYRMFWIKQLEKLKYRFIAWCRDHNLEIDTIEERR